MCRGLCLRMCAHTSVLHTSMPKSRGVQEGESMYMHACYLDPVQTRDAGTFIYVHVIEKRGTLCRHVCG